MPNPLDGIQPNAETRDKHEESSPFHKELYGHSGKTAAQDKDLHDTLSSESGKDLAELIQKDFLINVADLQTLDRTLPKADKTALLSAISKSDATPESISDAIAAVPKQHLLKSIEQMPADDVKAAMQVVDRNSGKAEPGKPLAQDKELSKQLAHEDSPALAMLAKRISGLYPEDMSLLFKSLPKEDQSALQSAAKRFGATCHDLTMAMGRLPKHDFLSAYAKLPSTDVQIAMRALDNERKLYKSLNQDSQPTPKEEL